MPRLQISLAALACVATLVSCSPLSVAPAQDQTPAAQSAAGEEQGAQNQFDGVAVSASCGGGVTGGAHGVSVAADDRITSWSRTTFSSARVETDLGVDQRLADSVRDELNAMGFAEMQLRRPGNMTCSLTAGDHTVAWPMGDQAVPAPVVALHARLMSLARGE